MYRSGGRRASETNLAHFACLPRPRPAILRNVGLGFQVSEAFVLIPAWVSEPRFVFLPLTPNPYLSLLMVTIPFVPPFAISKVGIPPSSLSVPERGIDIELGNSHLNTVLFRLK